MEDTFVMGSLDDIMRLMEKDILEFKITDASFNGKLPENNKSHITLLQQEINRYEEFMGRMEIISDYKNTAYPEAVESYDNFSKAAVDKEVKIHVSYQHLISAALDQTELITLRGKDKGNSVLVFSAEDNIPYTIGFDFDTTEFTVIENEGWKCDSEESVVDAIEKAEKTLGQRLPDSIDIYYAINPIKSKAFGPYKIIETALDILIGYRSGSNDVRISFLGADQDASSASSAPAVDESQRALCTREEKKIPFSMSHYYRVQCLSGCPENYQSGCEFFNAMKTIYGTETDINLH